MPVVVLVYSLLDLLPLATPGYSRTTGEGFRHVETPVLLLTRRFPRATLWEWPLFATSPSEAMLLAATALLRLPLDVRPAVRPVPSTPLNLEGATEDLRPVFLFV